MRAVLLGGALGLLALGSACNERAAAPAPSDGTLVLEIGGEQASLRASLATFGLSIGPPQRLRDLPPVAPEEPAPGNGGANGANEPPEPQQNQAEPPAPAPGPANEIGFKTVALKNGQTLIHLAKEHLGDGNRFRELLVLNGWTDADARRLAPGTKVRVPLDKKSPPRARR